MSHTQVRIEVEEDDTWEPQSIFETYRFCEYKTEFRWPQYTQNSRGDGGEEGTDVVYKKIKRTPVEAVQIEDAPKDTAKDKTVMDEFTCDDCERSFKSLQVCTPFPLLHYTPHNACLLLAHPSVHFISFSLFASVCACVHIHVDVCRFVFSFLLLFSGAQSAQDATLHSKRLCFSQWRWSRWQGWQGWGRIFQEA